MLMMSINEVNISRVSTSLLLQCEIEQQSLYLSIYIYRKSFDLIDLMNINAVLLSL